MTTTSKPPLPSRTRSAARWLRQSVADAERHLWQRLRASQLGFKFRRQLPVPPYVLDFYCADRQLGVELDGSQHDEGVDAARTVQLGRLGIVLLRFWDNDVLSNTDSVLEAIVRALENRTLTPCPSPDGRGEHSEAPKGPSPDGRGEHSEAPKSPSPTGRGVGVRVRDDSDIEFTAAQPDTKA